MSTKLCFLLLGDDKQYRDYKDFKLDLEEHASGRLDIEDVLDLAGSCGDNQSQGLKDYLHHRDAVILVCSQKLKDCIEKRHAVQFKLRGRQVQLDGGVLNECLARDDVKKKTILVSLDGDDTKHVPSLLAENPHFDADNKDVNDQIMGSILAMNG